MLLRTTPTAPESAYCIVEAVQNAAPERRRLRLNLSADRHLRVRSQSASTPGIGQYAARRESA